jgi:hypothetical protein
VVGRFLAEDLIDAAPLDRRLDGFYRTANDHLTGNYPFEGEDQSPEWFRRPSNCQEYGGVRGGGWRPGRSPLTPKSQFGISPSGENPGRVEGLDEKTLLILLQTYEIALQELGKMDDPLVTGLMRRLERRRTQCVIALANLSTPGAEN